MPEAENGKQSGGVGRISERVGDSRRLTVVGVIELPDALALHQKLFELNHSGRGQKRFGHRSGIYLPT